MRLQVLFASILSVIAFGEQASDQPIPAVMTKVVVRLESPDIPQGTFPTLPKVIYRAGSRYCRIEELPDNEHGVYSLIIINEPDIWLVNRLDNTVIHKVDPGPTFNCRLPIFFDNEYAKSAGNTSAIIGPEFGQELAFFSKNGATPTSGPTLHGKVTNAYSVEVNDSNLLLFTSGKPEQPVAVVRQREKKREVYWYNSYQELNFDAMLFARPNGKIEGVK